MGYDIWASGAFVINPDRIDEARPAIYRAIAEKNGCDIPAWADTAFTSTIDWVNNALERMNCTLLDYRAAEELERGIGDLIFQPPRGESFRCADDDLWFFKAIAPFCDPFYSSISFDGEDGYKWRWDIINGQLEEVGSETIYGADVNAPAVVEQIVDLIYPEELKGRPITTQSLEPYEVEAALVKVETLLREANFGPQAGKNELERLADV